MPSTTTVKSIIPIYNPTIHPLTRKSSETEYNLKKNRRYKLIVLNSKTSILITSILIITILMTSIFMTSILMTSILITSILITSILMTSILMTSIFNSTILSLIQLSPSLSLYTTHPFSTPPRNSTFTRKNDLRGLKFCM